MPFRKVTIAVCDACHREFRSYPESYTWEQVRTELQHDGWRVGHHARIVCAKCVESELGEKPL